MVVLALAPVASALLVFAGATPQASACDTNSNSDHCYAKAFSNNTNTNHGVSGTINVHCLYQPNNGNSVTAEMWDQNSSAAYWVEVGIGSGTDGNGGYQNKNWFWADQRPTFGYFEHDFSQTASTDVGYPAEIVSEGNDTWDVFGEDGEPLMGQSTDNTAVLVQAVAGTEYEGSSTSGIRDVGSVDNLMRDASYNTWFNWGNGGTNENLGPGNYINGNYDGNSDESWKGPC
jgi:hypothetical protein